MSDLSITYGQAGFLLTIFFVIYSIFQPPAGILADRIGKIRVMIVGLIGMSGATSSPALPMTGCGWSHRPSSASAAVRSTRPECRSSVTPRYTKPKGKRMRIFDFDSVFGTMSSPLVVDGLAAIAGWRIALLGAALLGAGAAIATAILVSATLLITQLLGGIPLEILIAILSLWFAIIGVMMYANYPVKNALVSEQADTASSGACSASFRRYPLSAVQVALLSLACSQQSGGRGCVLGHCLRE